MEEIKKDLSSLTREELKEIIINESPELPSLLENFDHYSAQIQDFLYPVLQMYPPFNLPRCFFPLKSQTLVS